MMAALILVGCTPSSPAGGAGSPASMTSLVDTLAAAPAERQGDVTTYDAENLHEYVDGMAEYFIEAGFVRLAHSEWKAPGATGPAFVEADLYDMGSAEGALDVLADSRTPTAEYLPIGNEAVRFDGGIELRIGRYYAKLVARKDIQGQRDLVRAMAEALAKAAPAGPSDAALVDPLPASGLLPHSAAYVAKGFLGRDFLQHVLMASYEVQGRRVQLFIINAGTLERAQDLMTQWQQVLPPQPIGAPESSDRLSWTEESVGPVSAARKGQWLFGSIGDPAAARPLLDSLAARLQ
jgi:hypothetical protein